MSLGHKALAMNPHQPEEVSYSAARTGNLGGLVSLFSFLLNSREELFYGMMDQDIRVSLLGKEDREPL